MTMTSPARQWRSSPLGLIPRIYFAAVQRTISDVGGENAVTCEIFIFALQRLARL